MTLSDEVESKDIRSGEFKDPQYAREQEQDSKDLQTASHDPETQAGVKKIQAISASWTTGGLILAYVT